MPPVQKLAHVEPDANFTDALNSWVEETRKFRESVDAVNENLTIIAGAASGLSSFFRKWFPIGVGVIGLAWPTLGKYIAQATTMVLPH